MNHPMLSRERLKYLLSLGRKKERLETGQVIVEGANILEQLLCNGVMPLELYLEGDYPLPQTVGNTPVFKLQKGDLERISDTNHPQGIAALYPVPRPRDASFKTALYLDGISDPGNMGTIFRIAAAFGIGAILLSESCVEVSSPKVIRASLGSVYWLPYRVLPANLLIKQKLSLVCLDMKAELELMDYLPKDELTVYVIGSEAHGISAELVKASAASLKIAMQPQMESLNAAIATGILAHYLYVKS
ncbi:MAG TPA: RNA methyltransferase [Candidatus Cloacimonadota bacterium]|nr:RNA methyltransferase [Candidatus Cloacimonadota bacterium]